MDFLGRSGNKVFFASNDMAVVVDEKKNNVLTVDYATVLASSDAWFNSEIHPTTQSKELATAALTELDITIFSSSDRMHTIPKAVQEEAKRALEWRKEFKRGGTSVGLNTAKIIADGGQIGIKKIRHIAKYFPRHEVDKNGKGYKPGEDGYPSKGRIAWALWGGDAGQRWASAIVERENKKENSSLIASHGYYDFETPAQVELKDFDSDAMKYMVRVRMDGSGIDRLYAVKPCGTVLVWDDGCWDDLGHMSHDIDTYDKSLDDPYDKIEKMHVPINTEAAITVAALFDADPFSVRSLNEVSPEDHAVYQPAMYEMDFSIVDAIVAAPSFKTNQDGNYTPDERSQKATAQMRDALGRFAQTGSRVVVGKNSDLRGKIVSQDDAAQTVKVELDSGKFIDIAANQTQQEDTWNPVEQGRQSQGGGDLFGSNPIDTSGILGEPRTPVGFSAQMPGTLPALSREGLGQMLNDFPSWVSSQRKSADSAIQAPTIVPEFKEPDFFYDKPKFEWPKFKNAFNDPTLRAFLDDPTKRGWFTFDITNPELLEPTKTTAEVYKTKKDRDKADDLIRRYSSRYLQNSIIASAEESEAYKKPQDADVAPIYMAIVAEDDPQAVMNLIALIPKSPSSTAAMTFKRDPGNWVADESILQDLNSPTPPPVIVLDNEALEDVIKQIDGPAVAAQKQIENMKAEKQEITASGFSGGPNADRLKKYWIQGKGSSKVNWGASGDWERCVERLSTEMGARAQGYCALLQKEATGSWVTDAEDSLVASVSVNASGMPTEQEVLDFVALRAQRRYLKDRVLTAGGAYEVNKNRHINSSEFYIPLIIPEGIESGDGRIFSKGSITMRELPLPLLWQIKTGEGHNGSVVIGKILKMERTDDGIGNAYGIFDAGVYGQEAERLVRGGFIRGVSADLDKFEADEEAPETGSDEEEGKISSGRIKIKKARVMAVTLVPKPAFQECQIKMKESMQIQEEQMVPDGVYVDDVDALEASALVACGIVAGVIPTTPPAEWFNNPALKQATPLIVDDDGKVFGHIAAWHVDHIGMSFGTKPPRSRSKYAYFHTGLVRTEEGKDVPVGQLTLAGGHAALELNAQEAARHYDDTASAIADVHAGEDAYGIWVAGALRPGTSPEQVRALRASAPSGDWRPIKGQLELVAVCQVNVPGFPIARARVASGAVMALVAAGATTLARMKSDPVSDLKQRIAKLEEKENAPLVAAMETARAKVLSVKSEELAIKMGKAKKQIEKDSEYIIYGTDDGNPDDELAVIPRRIRKKLAQEGKALPDGSFPIRNINDLRNAVQAYGRAKIGSKAAVRRHIVKRAKSLDRADLVPENWKEASVDEIPSQGLTASPEDPCWDGYKQVGMKKGKGGKMVPNCVPVDASIEELSTDPKARREGLAEEGLALPEEFQQKSSLSNDEILLNIQKRLSIVKSVVAAGGVDRNRGNAENLRRYWTKGAGAVKIRWGTPGDWKRCVRYLSKYMGVRAKGYCQLRHKDATGVYTGSRLNPGKRKGRNNSIFSAFSEAEFGIFESFYGDPQDYMTEVTDLDMMEPVENIMMEPDSLYDSLWILPKSVVVLIKKCGYSSSDINIYDDVAKKELEIGMDDMDTPVDSYDDDGLLATKTAELAIEEEDEWVDVPDYELFEREVQIDEEGDGEPFDDDPIEVDDLIEDFDPEAEKLLKERLKGLKVKRKGIYTADTQPRDAAGRFRTVLARLKLDLGTSGSDRALDKIKEIENLDFVGNYSKATEAAGDLVNIIDRLDDGALNPDSLINVREGNRELGRVIANLPFAFGEQAQKIRFSDLPPALRDLIEDMIVRVEAKIGKEDADIATKELRTFMSGGDFFSQSDVSSQMAKMLRLLT